MRSRAIMERDYQHRRDRARKLYEAIGSVRCPYLDEAVSFNAKGWHHLRYSAGNERSKEAQKLKFSLLPAARRIVQRSGTVQEYRRQNIPMGPERRIQQVEYWGFVALAGGTNGKERIRVRVVARREGNGSPIFWSIMPAMKLKNGEDAYDQMM